MPAARKPKTKAVAKKRKAALTPKKAETPKGKTQDVIQLKRAENDVKERKRLMNPKNSKEYKKLQERVKNLKSQRKA
jgi:hypothetical protein